MSEQADQPQGDATLTAEQVGPHLAGITVKAFLDGIANPEWRIRNLYWVTNKKGQKVLFVPWTAQEELFRTMWWRNIILKARQRGFCLDPDMRVLTSDLRWIRIDDVQPGQRIVATDEEPPGGRGPARKMRTAVVEAKSEVFEPAYRVVFDDGRSVVCTGRHRWLSRPSKGVVGAEWRSIENGNKKKLRVGSLVRWITKPWDGEQYEDGWFGGLLDGEGCLRSPSTCSVSISLSQVAGAVLDRARNYLSSRGYAFREEIDGRKSGLSSKLGNKPVHRLVISRMDEAFRLLGQCQPSRFIKGWWEGRDLPGKRSAIGWAKIVSIEPLPAQRMIDLQTSEKTFICEGFVSHNSTGIQILGLDTCLFTSNTNAAIVADTEENATLIFRKVKFAYDNLPQYVLKSRTLARDSASELILSNGSSMRVAVSARSSTLQFLHVSEFAKICAHFPERAREIVTGTLPAAEAGVSFIEGTAEGQEGPFYEMATRAQANRDTKGKVLSRHEYKFHFAGWWDAEEYVAEAASVVISGKDHDYFDKIETLIERKIEIERRAWYIVTRDNAFSGDAALMKQEYPSIPEEAFEQSSEGVYYADQMAAARRTGRVDDFAYDPRVPVNTFWDLGKDDDTAIWFHQHISGWDNWINYIESSDQAFSYYVQQMQAMGYVWGKHYLPHDGGGRNWGTEQLKTSEDLLHDLGLRNIVIVPVTPNVGVAIRQCRDAFPQYRFDKTRCKAGLLHLDHYRKSWNERLGAWSEVPQKNGHQHAPDALRQHAQMFVAPVREGTFKRRKRASGMVA